MNDTIVKVVGKQVVDFLNKDTGEKIQGVNLFVLAPDENVEGFKAHKQFIGTQSLAYAQAYNLDVLHSPVDVKFVYKYKIGQKTPQLVGIELV